MLYTRGDHIHMPPSFDGTWVSAISKKKVIGLRILLLAPALPPSRPPALLPSLQQRHPRTFGDLLLQAPDSLETLPPLSRATGFLHFLGLPSLGFISLPPICLRENKQIIIGKEIAEKPKQHQRAKEGTLSHTRARART